jgi:lipopolysaccharide/colanic/teichoic acid biosynthesis glycosyltransferase
MSHLLNFQESAIPVLSRQFGNDQFTVPLVLEGNEQHSLHSIALKRVLDLSIVIGSLFLLWPIFLVIALAIWRDSEGPIFFLQERVGAKPRPENNHVLWEIQTFKLFKFRSMFHDSDQTLHEEHIKSYVTGTVETLNDSEATFKMRNDRRITKIGRLLRRSSLDELPQLFNVLKGDMSLVGPRPVPTYEVRDHEARHYERLTALPGITGLWQVKGRGEVTFEEMMRMDIEYARNQSFWLDLKLLIETIPAVLSGRGAA